MQNFAEIRTTSSNTWRKKPYAHSSLITGLPELTITLKSATTKAHSSSSKKLKQELVFPIKQSKKIVKHR
jgi:hypothetical protein